MKKIVVFTGAGISADSGIATFRDSDGLWANYCIEDVCTPEALFRNRENVIDFYNIRRKELLGKHPNNAHLALVELEKQYHVDIVTQNIDDLHERAGSTNVTHLHGDLRKLRSENGELATVPIDGWEQKLDARHPDGSLLRPFIVFFGENVPLLSQAIELVKEADIFMIVGTSLAVYPAASLIHYVKPHTPIFLVDPGNPDTRTIISPFTHINAKAAEGVPILVKQLCQTN